MGQTEGTELGGSMQRSLLTGAIVVTGLQLASKIIEVGFAAVLARLLVPADFGVIAGSMIFIAFASMLVEIGIGATLVQLPDLSKDDVRAAGTLVMLNAFVYCILSIVLAPLIALFLNIPEVTPVLRVLSLVFLIQAIGIVPENLMVKRLQAPRVMMTQLLARFLGTGGVGIAMALLGYGYWSLVGATLAETAIKAIALFALVRPPARPLLRRDLTRRLMRKGSGFSASKLLNFIATRADNAIVGHTMSAAALGIYSRAYNLMNMPADLYSRVAERLIFPALAVMQNDQPRLQRAFLRSLEITAAIGIPMSVLLAIFAPEIIRIVLGPKWDAVVVPFAVLSTVSYFRLGAKVSGSVQRAKGAFRPMIISQIVYAFMVVGGCLATYRFGIVALSCAVSIGVLAFYLVVNFNACRLLNVRAGAFLAAHLPGVLIGVLFGAVAAPVAVILRNRDESALVILCAEGIAGGVLCLILFAVRPRLVIGEAAADLADDLLKRLNAWRRRSRTSGTAE